MDIKKTIQFAIGFFLLMILSACGASKQANTLENGEMEPVTITIGMNEGAYLTDEEAERYFINPVKEKYPHITVKMVHAYDLEGMIAAKKTPDIVVGDLLTLNHLKDFGLQMDITELIERHDMDISRFEDYVIEATKMGSDTDYLVGIPYTRHFNALYYNKEIFDRFGEPYPEDGLTWDDAKEIAERLTQEVDGVQYRGLEPDSVYRAGSQRSLPIIDPRTYKSLINTDEWADAYSLVTDIYKIPGNETTTFFDDGVSAFIEGRLAMFASLNYLAYLDDVADEFSSWDLATYPSWKELPGVGPQVDLHLLLPNEFSANLDDAFRVIETIVSDDVQLEMVNNGRASVLNDEKFQNSFGENLEILADKNVESIFKTTPAIPEQTISTYFNLWEITDYVNRILEEDLDMNTALRILEEEMNIRIENEQENE